MTLSSIAIIAVLASGADPAFEWKKEDGRTVLYQQGKPVLAYNHAAQLAAGVPEDRRRCCYVHPLWTPGGVVVTDDFPKDHYHHRGLFWAWPVVEAGGRQYDLWMMKGVRHRSVSVEARGRRLEASNEWIAEGKPIVREKVSMEANPAAAASAFELDFELALEALSAPVTLAGSPDKGKSYGGAVNIRFAPRENTVIRTEAGVLPKDDDLTAHGWAEFEAVYGGKRASLTIIPDSRNPGLPHQWCLRAYGFMGASFPGRTAQVQSYTLQPGKPLVLRHRVKLSDR